MTQEQDRERALRSVEEQAQAARTGSVPDGYEQIDGYERLVWLKSDGSFRSVGPDEIRRLAATLLSEEETDRRFAEVDKAFEVPLSPALSLAGGIKKALIRDASAATGFRKTIDVKLPGILYVACPKCHDDKPYGYRCGAPDCPQKAGAE